MQTANCSNEGKFDALSLRREGRIGEGRGEGKNRGGEKRRIEGWGREGGR